MVHDTEFTVVTNAKVTVGNPHVHIPPTNMHKQAGIGCLSGIRFWSVWVMVIFGFAIGLSVELLEKMQSISP